MAGSALVRCGLAAALAALCAAGPAACPGRVPVSAGPLVPTRVDAAGPAAWTEAMRALWRDGAVVLSGLAGLAGSDFRALAGRLPQLLLEGAGLQLLSPEAPVSGVHEELREAQRRGLYVPGSGLLPHTDGYVYGDDLPDFVFLLCEQPAPRGGANVLLDGQALMGELDAGGEEARELSSWLRATDVDLSEPDGVGIIAGRPAEGPVVQQHRGASGRLRLKWRRQIDVREAQRDALWWPLEGDNTSAGAPAAAGPRYLSLWRPLASAEPEAAALTGRRLRELDEVLQCASSTAFAEHSFQLARGEALVVDNYRVLHGRGAYAAEGEERRLWRVWAWTSEGSGLPPGGAKTSQPLDDGVFGEGGQGRADL